VKISEKGPPLDRRGERRDRRAPPDRPSNVVEVKSKHALARKRRPELLAAIARIGDRGDIYMLDKSFYTTALMLDLLGGAHAAEYDFELGQSGVGAQLARDLHTLGPSAVGALR
jgi:hypothetical protein